VQPDRVHACGCGATAGVRLSACGWRCPAHTPAALAGRPEPGSARYCAPLRCYCGGCASYGRPLEPVLATVVDVRAVASGRRRVRSLAEYRAAQAQVREGRDA
jgi:hypothetical protein